MFLRALGTRMPSVVGGSSLLFKMHTVPPVIHQSQRGMAVFIAKILEAFDVFIYGHPDNVLLMDKRKLTGWKLDAMKTRMETCGLYQLGLKAHDILDDETNQIVRKAADMLEKDTDPKARDLYDQRTFRQIRAMQLDVSGFKELPPEDWMTFEEDDPYLTPYIRKVQADLKERKKWTQDMGYP